MSTNQVRLIESPANPQFKLWKSCLESQGIKKHGQLFLSGKKLVDEFLRDHKDKVVALIGYGDIEAMDIPTYSISKNLFNELDLLGTGQALLLIEAPQLQAWRNTAPKGIEIFLALQDPGNVGAALRLAEAFSVSKVVCLKECAYPFHPKALKASSGSALKVPLFKGPSITELAAANADFLGLDKNGTLISEFQWPKNFRLVLGEEGRGLPAELKTQSLKIPIHENLESLNATSALSIALYAHSLSLKKG